MRNKRMVTNHSDFTMLSGPATVTTAWIPCNVIRADSDTTVSIAIAVVDARMTCVIQWTVAADVTSRTCTQEWAGSVGAWRSIQAHSGI